MYFENSSRWFEIKSSHLKALQAVCVKGTVYIKLSIKYNIFNGDVSSIFLCVKLLDKGPNLNRIAGVEAIFFLSVILHFSRIWSFMVVWGWDLGLGFWAWVFQLMGFGTCGVGSSSFFFEGWGSLYKYRRKNLGKKLCGVVMCLDCGQCSSV